MFLIARWVQIKQIFYWIQLQKEPKNCSTLTIWLICWAIYFSPLMPLQECCCANFQTLTISIQKHSDKNFAKNALSPPVLRTKHPNRMKLQLHCSDDVKMGEKLQRVRACETELLKCLRCANRRRQFAINIPRR